MPLIIGLVFRRSLYNRGCDDNRTFDYAEQWQVATILPPQQVLTLRRVARLTLALSRTVSSVVAPSVAAAC